MKNLDAEKTVFYIIGGLTVFVIILIVIFSVNEQKQVNGGVNIASYSATDSNRPKAKTDLTFFDLGKMSVKDEKKADFTVENTGSKPLILSKISSSCDCTVGTVDIEGNKSPEFGMHAKGSWTGNIEPGKKAVVSVIYRPSIMPVSGIVTRDVYINSNDPENPKLTFTVKADVE